VSKHSTAQSPKSPSARSRLGPARRSYGRGVRLDREDGRETAAGIGWVGRDGWPVLAALGLCPLGAALVTGDPGGPIARAHELVGAERVLGLHSEPALVGWLHAHAWLSSVAGLFYVWVHLPALVGALVWVWLERRWAFAVVRDTFVIGQVVTVTGNLAFATAPPWMLSDPAGHPIAAGDVAYLVQSPYAAMPSGHTMFAAIAAGTVVARVRSPLVRVIAVASPLLVGVVIVATGNHLWLDCVGGALAATLGFGAARLRAGWTTSRARRLRLRHGATAAEPCRLS
jgi:PAP2 superfamily